MKTLNHDDEEPQNVMDAVLAGIEDVHRRQKLGGLSATDEEESTKPPGYGTLGQTYEWRSYETPGARAYVRSWCLTDDKWMTLTLKVDPRYGKHTSRFADKVDFNGKPVQCWECRDCGQWVVK